MSWEHSQKDGTFQKIEMGELGTPNVWEHLSQKKKCVETPEFILCRIIKNSMWQNMPTTITRLFGDAFIHTGVIKLEGLGWACFVAQFVVLGFRKDKN